MKKASSAKFLAKHNHTQRDKNKIRVAWLNLGQMSSIIPLFFLVLVVLCLCKGDEWMFEPKDDMTAQNEGK
jgi:hypothetical protein